MDEQQPRVVRRGYHVAAKPPQNRTAKLLNELTEQEMKAIINARYPNLRERIKNEPKEFLIGFLQAVGLHESERFVIPEMDGEPTNPLPKINRRWGGY